MTNAAENDNVILDNNGATWLGMRVAGWTWEEDAFSPDQSPSENTMRHYASHWSTGPHNAERLYRENDVAALLSKLRAEGVQAGDERAAFEAWNSKHGQYRRSDAYERDDNGHYLEWAVENGWRVWQARAALASEAVRIQFPAHLRKMWSGGEVQAWLDEHQGVTPPKVSAKGSLERYRKWQAEREEAFGAGVKAAADLVKKMVDDYDTDHGSTDPETGTREYPGDGAAWVCDMEELEGSIRALSAQPAQKERSE